MSVHALSAPCWVVLDSGGDPWREDHDTHHVSFADADAAITDLRDDRDCHDDIDVARLDGLHTTQLRYSCVTVTCDGCGEGPYSDEYRRLHFEAGGWQAADYEWTTTDGRDWCPECTEPTIEPSPDVPGQVTLNEGAATS